MIILSNLIIETLYNVSRAHHNKNNNIILKNEMVEMNNDKDKPYITYKSFYSNFQKLYDLPVNNIHEVSIRAGITYRNEPTEKIKKLDSILSMYKDNENISYKVNSIINKDIFEIDPIIYYHVYDVSITLYKKTNPTKQDYKNVKIYNCLIKEIGNIILKLPKSYR